MTITTWSGTGYEAHSVYAPTYIDDGRHDEAVVGAKEKLVSWNVYAALGRTEVGRPLVVFFIHKTANAA